jgi:hypothetical protein
MKKLVLALIFAFSSPGIFAQSYTFIDVIPKISGPSSGEMLEAKFKVKNSGNTSKSVAIRKIIIDTIPGSSVSFCWGIHCYGDQMYDCFNDPIVMAPGDIDSSFVGSYNPRDTPGSSHVRYLFYDVNNPNDSASVLIEYDAIITGIEKLHTGEMLSPAFPNPANSIVNIKYLFNKEYKNRSLKIYNVLGTLLKEIPLNEKEGSAKIPVNEMETGIYFYSLVADGKTLATQKLLVRH